MSIIPNWIKYDAARDELVIHGVRYAAPMFGPPPHGLLAPVGTEYRVEAGPRDVVTLARVDRFARRRRSDMTRSEIRTVDVLRQVSAAIEAGTGKIVGGNITFEPRDTVLYADSIASRPRVPDQMRVSIDLRADLHELVT